jgi:hypothetical protein
MHKILIYLFIYNTFIKILYMFRALPCSSSGGLRRNCIYMQPVVSSLSAGEFCFVNSTCRCKLTFQISTILQIYEDIMTITDSIRIFFYILSDNPLYSRAMNMVGVVVFLYDFCWKSSQFSLQIIKQSTVDNIMD